MTMYARWELVDCNSTSPNFIQGHRREVTWHIISSSHHVCPTTMCAGWLCALQIETSFWGGSSGLNHIIYIHACIHASPRAGSSGHAHHGILYAHMPSYMPARGVRMGACYCYPTPWVGRGDAPGDMSAAMTRISHDLVKDRVTYGRNLLIYWIQNDFMKAATTSSILGTLLLPLSWNHFVFSKLADFVRKSRGPWLGQARSWAWPQSCLGVHHNLVKDRMTHGPCFITNTQAPEPFACPLRLTNDVYM
jgi:hypothetical protein